MWTAVLLGIALKATVVLAAAGVLHVALLRSSAAARHLMWHIALAGLLAIPVLSLLLPSVPLGAASEVTVTHGAASARLGMPASPPPPGARARTAPIVIAAVWLAGTLALLARLGWGVWRVRRMVRDSREIRNREWLALRDDAAGALGLAIDVPLREAPRAAMPMAWGLGRPVILLPPEAHGWGEEKRRAVLLHELAHIERNDCGSHLVARISCAVYWPHPLAWLALRQLAAERERACDDRVLGAGTRASEYAAHLLDVARGMKARRDGALAALAMARHSQIRERLAAILDGRMARTAPTQSSAVFAATALLSLVLPLAAMRPFGQAVKGTVYDGTGAVVPNALVTLRDGRGGAVSVKSDAIGRYLFRDAAAGRGLLEVRSRGFALYRAEFALGRGAELNHEVKLQVGALRESIRVSGAP